MTSKPPGIFAPRAKNDASWMRSGRPCRAVADRGDPAARLFDRSDRAEKACVEYWTHEIGLLGLGIGAKAYSPRTLLVLNPDPEVEVRVRSFCARWKDLRGVLHVPKGVSSIMADLDRG